MPYKIVKSGSEYEVQKDTGESVGKHKTRKSALAHLRALEINVEDANDMKSNLILGSVHFEADAENPRFLRFHDAVLARAETNANRDNLDETGIEELASTIAGTALDLEHDPAKNVGYYTAGRAVNNELRVDGVLWLDRCEALGVDPNDVLSGKYGLSIEAEAQTAECSLCHTTHDSVASYCEHLRNKLRYSAERLLRGLKAVGGAITKTPAGTGTRFGTMVFVASHQEELDMNEVEAVEKREDVSPLGGIEIADKNKDESSIDPNVPPDNQIEGVEMEDETKETPEQEKVESPKEENGMEAEYMTMKKSLEEMTAKLDEAQKEKDEAVKACDLMKTEKDAVEAKVAELTASLTEAQNTVKAHRVESLKSKLVGSVMDESEFEAQKDVLLGLPQETIEIMARAQKPEGDKPKMSASVESPADGVVKISLY